MATTEEKLLTYLANSKNGGQLPVLVNIQDSEFFIIYNPSTDRFEKVLISTLLTDDLIIDALGYTPEDIANKAIDFSVKNNNLYPSTKAVDDFITGLKSAPNGLAGTDGDGKIPASLLPPIAVTSVILATQTTIADFAANSGSYTFEQGDVIILDSGNGSYYMYNGGTKTDVSAYNEITASEIDWSQITNIPTDVENPTLSTVLNNGNSSSKNMVLDTDIGGAGLKVSNNDTTSTSSAIEVTSNAGRGIYVNNTEGTGIKVNNTGGTGIFISNSSGFPGIDASSISSQGSAIRAQSTGSNGKAIEAIATGGNNSSAIRATALGNGTATEVVMQGANSNGVSITSRLSNSGDSIVVKKFVSGSVTEDRFKIDSEGNTTTQKLTIEDVAEDLTADKLAVIDADGNVGYIDKDYLDFRQFGLGSNTKENNNWDTISETGYYYNSSSSAVGTPDSFTDIVLEHVNYGSTAAVQNAYRLSPTNTETWYRRKSSGTWGEWFLKNDSSRFKYKKIYATDNSDAASKGIAVGEIYTNSVTGVLTERFSFDIPLNRTIDDPTTQTSPSLNSAFPFAENPVGTTVTNINALQLFMYVRISELLWRVITLGTTI